MFNIMKLKIKVKRINKNIELPKIIDKGEWVDLRAAGTFSLLVPQAETLKTHTLNGIRVSHRDVNFDYRLIPLGIAIKLPKGFEAIVAPRSSTYKNYGVIQTNSIGIIDNSYSGDSDEWKMPVLAFRDAVINEGDRVCQFRIQLSQKATMWQKIKWLFSSGIKLEEVESLGDNNRGGFCSTGVN